jgi:hypothetical protein
MPMTIQTWTALKIVREVTEAEGRQPINNCSSEVQSQKQSARLLTGKMRGLLSQ